MVDVVEVAAAITVGVVDESFSPTVLVVGGTVERLCTGESQ